MENRLMEIIASQFNMDIKDLSLNTSFLDDLNADSIDIVELIINIEDEFDIKIDDNLLKKVNTISDVVHFLENATI